jgi:hypothetical protein
LQELIVAYCSKGFVLLFCFCSPPRFFPRPPVSRINFPLLVIDTVPCLGDWSCWWGSIQGFTHLCIVSSGPSIDSHHAECVIGCAAGPSARRQAWSESAPFATCPRQVPPCPMAAQSHHRHRYTFPCSCVPARPQSTCLLVSCRLCCDCP